MKFIDVLQTGIQQSEFFIEKIISDYEERNEIMASEIMIVLLMFRKIVEKADGVFILCDNGGHKAAESITRDMFENYLYLRYMIEGNYKEKAYAYMFQNLKEEQQMINTFVDKDKVREEIVPLLGGNVVGIAPTMLERKNYIKDRIKDKSFHNIRVEWDRMLEQNRKGKGKKSPYPTWYNLNNGPKTIKALSIKFGMSAMHSVIYSVLSKQVHSANIMQQIKMYETSGVVLAPLRVPFDGVQDDNVNLTLSISLLADSLLYLINFLSGILKVSSEDWLIRYNSWC